MRGFIVEKPTPSLAERGWGNGYVVIPEEHPLHGKDYDEIDVEVHGGLTFAASAKELDWKELLPWEKEGWVVGFDTAHYGDNLTNWPRERVLKETSLLSLRLQQYEDKKPDSLLELVDRLIESKQK